MPNPVPTPTTRRDPPASQAIAWLAGETRLALSTRHARAQLADPDAWTDQHGHRHPIEAMTPEQANAAMRVLGRRARRLHRGAIAEYLLAPYPHRQHPQRLVDAAHQQLVDTDPQAWLTATPLMRGLRSRARSR